MTEQFELRAQFAEVVNLAVVYDRETSARVCHWLSRRIRQIDYGESPMAEGARSVDEYAFAIRTTMCDRTHHAPYGTFRRGRRTQVKRSSESAHDAIPPSRPRPGAV